MSFHVWVRMHRHFYGASIGREGPDLLPRLIPELGVGIMESYWRSVLRVAYFAHGGPGVRKYVI